MTGDDCAALVQRGDPDRFAATMAAPEAARAALWPLYAFNLEVAQAPWVTKEPLIAEMRLQWWRDVLEEAAAGGAVRAHEVATPLAALIRARGLPLDLLDGIVVARQWDIHSRPFADGAAFQAHISATAGNLMVLAVRALGVAADPVARDLGYAMGLANWFRAVPALEARGRIPMVDGRAEAVRALAAEGLARLKRARVAGAPRAALPALWAGWQAGPLLAQAVREPGRVADGALGQSEFARRGGLVWRVLAGRY